MFVTEPVLTTMAPIPRDRYYLCHWFVAETLPQADEEAINASVNEVATETVERPYMAPPKYPPNLTLKQRVKMDQLEVGQVIGPSGNSWKQAKRKSKWTKDKGALKGKRSLEAGEWYEPRHHEGTGVNDLEAGYVSKLVPIETAFELLQGVQDEEVLRLAWEAIGERWFIEKEAEQKTRRPLEEHGITDGDHHGKVEEEVEEGIGNDVRKEGEVVG